MSRFSLLVMLLVVVTIKSALSSSRPYHHHHHLHRLDYLLEFFDTYKLQDAIRRTRAVSVLSQRCRSEIVAYLSALHDGEPWADKMFDATGRYNAQFLFGNDFFLGSQTLCTELSRNTSLWDLDKSRGDPSSFLRWREYPPPFKVNYHVIKLKIKLPPERFQENTRVVFWGTCLPEGCSSADSREVVQISAAKEKNEPSTIEVINSRVVPGGYSLWNDSTFILLIVFSFFILLLICIGTLMDFGEYKNSENTARLTMGDRYCNRFSRNSQIPSASRRSALRSTVKEVLLCFSLARNAMKIMNGSEEERERDASIQDNRLEDRERFSCLHGIRFLSIAWIIGGHSCYISILYADNKQFRGVTERDFLYQTIGNSPYAVDTFFFISGLLLAYHYFQSTNPLDVTEVTPTTPSPQHPSKSAGNRVIRFCGLLIYRILRLTPPYLFIIGVLEVANKQYRSDSVFEPSNDDDLTCAKYWWRNILYINTLFPAKEMCMLWSWYLSDDTQFYIIGLTLLTIASSHFNIATFFTVTLLLSSWVSTGFIALEYGYTPRISEPFALFDELYDKPWTRVGPFIVGLAAGWILYKKNCKININKGTTVIGWMVSMTIFFILIYGLHGRTIGPMASAFYAVFSHSAWGFGILWLVIICATGKGGWINSFLSWKPLAPFSRISYCAYLVHPIVIRASVSQIDSPLHASRDSFIFLYCGHFLISYLLAFAVSVTLEAPIISLLKIFFRRIDNVR